MHGFETLLRRLAGQEPTAGASPEGLRRQVESSLTPLIRCALERGVGAPALVRWVKQTVPVLGAGERTPAALARRLCTSLVRQCAPGGGRADTTTGRGAAAYATAAV